MSLLIYDFMMCCCCNCSSVCWLG